VVATKVKRRKAFLVGRAASSSDARFLSLVRGRSGDADHGEISAFHPGRSAGSRRGWPVGRRTKGRRLMASRSGGSRTTGSGVMPAERVGRVPRAREGDPGRRNGGCSCACRSQQQKTRKGLPAGDPGTGLGRSAASAKAISKTGRQRLRRWRGAKRLTDALLKVASNKGLLVRTADDRGAGQISGRSCCQVAGRPAGGEVSARRIRGVSSQAGGGQRGLGIPDVIDRLFKRLCGR